MCHHSRTADHVHDAVRHNLRMDNGGRQGPHRPREHRVGGPRLLTGNQVAEDQLAVGFSVRHHGFVSRRMRPPGPISPTAGLCLDGARNPPLPLRPSFGGY